VTTAPERADHRTADRAAGFLATLSIVASALALTYRPVRLLPFAFLLALIAVGMAPRGSKLPLIAVLFGAVAFVVAITIQVLAENPLF
jgi:hypothetical protein